MLLPIIFSTIIVSTQACQPANSPNVRGNSDLGPREVLVVEVITDKNFNKKTLKTDKKEIDDQLAKVAKDNGLVKNRFIVGGIAKEKNNKLSIIYSIFDLQHGIVCQEVDKTLRNAKENTDAMKSIEKFQVTCGSEMFEV
ncbi:hypothetical protein RB195_012068 [Necator americanus]